MALQALSLLALLPSLWPICCQDPIIWVITDMLLGAMELIHMIPALVIPPHLTVMEAPAPLLASNLTTP